VVEGRIQLDVVVTDKSGKPVSGLELKDFTLLDNGQPGKILSFHAVDETVQKAHPPVEAILVIDTVNENHQQVSFVRQEIESFLRQNGGRLAQPVSIFLLTDEGVHAQPQLSTDGNALATMVDRLDDSLRIIGRSSGFWGASERYQFSLKMFDTIIWSEAKKPGRKLLIWAGSGWPLFDNPRMQSLYTSKDRQLDFSGIVQFSTRLREARIAVYSISAGTPGFGTFLYQDSLKGVKTPDKADLSYLNLKVLAVESGGRVTGPDNDLTAQISQCVQDATAYYTISFDPPHADRADEYHDLKVLVDKPGLTARTNTGYYNQP
jgi:VWFA-related protein